MNAVRIYWDKLSKDRKTVAVSVALVLLIAIISLPFIPEKEPSYFPMTVLISQFLVNLLLMSWKIKKVTGGMYDKKSRTFISTTHHWFLILYFFAMFPCFFLILLVDISPITFLPLIISRTYLFINNLPLSAMNLFVIAAEKRVPSEHEAAIKSIRDYHDEVRYSSSYHNTAGNIYNTTIN